MAASIPLDRRTWLGHRWQRHGFAGDAGRDVLEDLLLLGVQLSRLGAAEQALSQRVARVGSTGLPRAIRPGGPLIAAWTVRGAPHAHRPARLALVRDALAPVDSDEGGPEHVRAVAEVAAALRAVVTGPTPKGEASAAVTGRVPAGLVARCERCGSDHVPDELFRVAGRQAGLVLAEPDEGATVLLPSPDVPQETVPDPRRALLDAYARVNGPTTRPVFRDWAGLGGGAVGELWAAAGDLVPVAVDGRRCRLPEELVERVRAAPPAEGVALVPAQDPYLRQVDRTLLVPDRDRRSQVYRPLSGPGALLVDGEVAGTWRYRRAEGALTVTPFAPLRPSCRAAVDTAARRLATAAATDPPTLTWS